MVRLHAYFDYGSPYAYLGWCRISKVYPERYEGAEVLWKPVSAGHIFKQEGRVPIATLPNIGQYMRMDVARWANQYDVPFSPPADGTPGAMPVNSINAMRLHFIADQGGPELETTWMNAVFNAYFGDSRDISDEAVLDDLCQQVGVKDGPEACNHESIKRLLIANTQEAYDAGAPGVPYFILEQNDGTREVFWGNDRLPLVEERLGTVS